MKCVFPKKTIDVNFLLNDDSKRKCSYHYFNVIFVSDLNHVRHHLHGTYRAMVHHVFGGYPTDPDLPFDAKMGRWPIERRQPLLTR